MMKYTVFLFSFLYLTASGQNAVQFDQYFIDQTIRIDYFHTGNATQEEFIIDKIYKQGTWAGNPKNCIQPFELGIYCVKVYDSISNKLIFTKEYNSIYGEYRTIGPAMKGIKRTFHESILIPCPKKPVSLVIERRDRYNKLYPVYSQVVDPNDYHIITESFQRKSDEVIEILKNGNPHNKVDVVILGEGYTSGEKKQFLKDLKYYSDLLFSVEPYKSRKNLFNISGVFSPSEESGTDEPRQGIYKNTRFNSSFNYFDLDRYCLADDNKSIRDVAANVPYDAVIVMINRNRYGGGGIYNFQMVFNTGSSWRDYVFLHEFGHSFAGLADEYYSKPVSYVDFYTPGVEPLEPNVTALLDTANVKWEKYLSPGLKVPTEWGKATFDSLNNAMDKVAKEKDEAIGKLKKSNASEAEVNKVGNDYAVKLGKINKEIDTFIENHPLKGKVGVFEGANYLSKGFYRSNVMSLMHKFQENDRSFGIVNEQAIISTIDYYTGE